MFLLVYISANHTNTIFKISLRILLTWKSLSTIYSIRRITDNRTCGAEIEDDDFLVSIVMWHEKKGNHLGIALLVKTYKTNIFNIEGRSQRITNNECSICYKSYLLIKAIGIEITTLLKRIDIK